MNITPQQREAIYSAAEELMKTIRSPDRAAGCQSGFIAGARWALSNQPDLPAISTEIDQLINILNILQEAPGYNDPANILPKLKAIREKLPKN